MRRIFLDEGDESAMVGLEREGNSLELRASCGYECGKGRSIIVELEVHDGRLNQGPSLVFRKH